VHYNTTQAGTHFFAHLAFPTLPNAAKRPRSTPTDLSGS
jgi:hypothetical protein